MKMINQSNLAFVILSEDRNTGRIKSTRNSISNIYRDYETITITKKDITKEEIKEIELISPVYSAGDNVMSMINKGMEKISDEKWCIFITEGVIVHYPIDIKIFKFIDDEKDVIYPVSVQYKKTGGLERFYKFFDNTGLNGLTINKKLFNDVGNFIEENPSMSKFMWQQEALLHNARFKGLYGLKIC